MASIIAYIFLIIKVFCFKGFYAFQSVLFATIYKNM